MTTCRGLRAGRLGKGHTCQTEVWIFPAKTLFISLEAGALGKQVVGMTPSIYQAGGFQTPVYSAADLPALAMLGERSADTIRRQTLRFGYTTIYRVPQYVDHVRAVTSSKYEYVDGADPERLERLGIRPR